MPQNQTPSILVRTLLLALCMIWAPAFGQSATAVPAESKAQVRACIDERHANVRRHAQCVPKNLLTETMLAKEDTVLDPHLERQASRQRQQIAEDVPAKNPQWSAT